LQYAMSPRARTLLSVSAEWWNHPGVVQLKYEDCVADTHATLTGLQTFFGPARAELATVIAKTSLGEMRKNSVNNHFWKGQPGLWRALLPATAAYRIAWPLQAHLAELGYSVQPDESLTDEAADQNWRELIGPELGRTLRKSTEGHQTQLKNAWAAVKEATEQVQTAHDERDAVRMEAIEQVHYQTLSADTARWERDQLHTSLSECLADLSEAVTERAEEKALKERLAERLSATEQAFDDLRTSYATMNLGWEQKFAAQAKELAAEQERFTAQGADLAAEQEHFVAEQERFAALRSEWAASQAEYTATLHTLTTARDQLNAQLVATVHRHDAVLREADKQLAIVGKDWAHLQQELRASDQSLRDAEEKLNTKARQLESAQAELAGFRSDLSEAYGSMADLRSERDAARRDLARLRDQVLHLQRELDPFRGLSAPAIDMARKVQRIRGGWPRMLGFLRSAPKK
ncbi:MAG: hypothetical protein ACRCZF_20450, partial [Gemmataceae bacterium]